MRNVDKNSRNVGRGSWSDQIYSYKKNTSNKQTDNKQFELVVERTISKNPLLDI